MRSRLQIHAQAYSEEWGELDRLAPDLTPRRSPHAGTTPDAHGAQSEELADQPEGFSRATSCERKRSTSSQRSSSDRRDRIVAIGIVRSKAAQQRKHSLPACAVFARRTSVVQSCDVRVAARMRCLRTQTRRRREAPVRGTADRHADRLPACQLAIGNSHSRPPARVCGPGVTATRSGITKVSEGLES